MAKAKIRWLDRRIAAAGPFLTLCTDERQYKEAMRHLNLSAVPAWVSPGASATTHHASNADGRLACIVCIDGWRGRDPVEVAGLLVHEAVHVWQEYADGIGEREPGREQEAYAVQSIAQELMAEFRRQMTRKAGAENRVRG